MDAQQSNHSEDGTAPQNVPTGRAQLYLLSSISKPCNEVWTWPFTSDHHFVDITFPTFRIAHCLRCGRSAESYQDEFECEVQNQMYLFNLNH